MALSLVSISGPSLQWTTASSASLKEPLCGPSCGPSRIPGGVSLAQSHQPKPATIASHSIQAANRSLAAPSHLLLSSFSAHRSFAFSQSVLESARWQETRRPRSTVQIFAKDGGENLGRFVSIAVRTGRQGLDAATKFVPESVPRPVATAGVALTGVVLLTWVAKALFNTVLSLVVLGGLGYAAFMYYTKDDGSDEDEGKGGSSSGGSSSDDPLDEARRIMEKYK